MNSLLQCPLPIEILLEVLELLGVNASTRTIDLADPGTTSDIQNCPSGDIRSKESSHSIEETKASMQAMDSPSTEAPQHIFSLLSACNAQLIRAETMERKRACVEASTIPCTMPSNESGIQTINTQVYEPLLPPPVAEQMQEAMHEALMNVMTERDEAHAQLIALNELHVHELEQKRHKIEKLRVEQQLKEERARFQQPNVSNFFQNLHDDRARRNLEAKFDDFEWILGKNTDEELAQTSRQLAEEVSAKTSHALEKVRLKETRELERRNEATEKQALKDELARVKALLAKQEAKK